MNTFKDFIINVQCTMLKMSYKWSKFFSKWTHQQLVDGSEIILACWSGRSATSHWCKMHHPDSYKASSHMCTLHWKHLLPSFCQYYSEVKRGPQWYEHSHERIHDIHIIYIADCIITLAVSLNMCLGPWSKLHKKK